MKLAEALILRADYQRRLEQLKARVLRNAKVQDGEQPSEDPAELTAEFEQLVDELGKLVARINLTNAGTQVDGRQTMTEALARRDMLKQRAAMYRDLAEEATITQSIVTKTEVRFISTVTVSKIQQKADAIAKELRELDSRIQGANWQIELS